MSASSDGRAQEFGGVYFSQFFLGPIPSLPGGWFPPPNAILAVGETVSLRTLGRSGKEATLRQMGWRAKAKEIVRVQVVSTGLFGTILAEGRSRHAVRIDAGAWRTRPLFWPDSGVEPVVDALADLVGDSRIDRKPRSYLRR